MIINYVFKLILIVDTQIKNQYSLIVSSAYVVFSGDKWMTVNSLIQFLILKILNISLRDNKL